MQKLERLFESRRRIDTRSDFVIGTGDVLEISIPAMEQLKTVDTRVLGDGTIMLPLLGRVSAAGKTEEELGDGLRQRLRRYMYHPQLGIFVKEYQNRGVNVMGALDKPGLYTLANPHETILSMIGKAGGLSDKAGARIFLLPAEINAAGMNPAAADASLFDSTVSDDEQGQSAVAPDRPQRQSPTARIDTAASHNPPSVASPEAGQYLLIDLGIPSLRKYLEIPAKPGDTIIVSQAGEVAVQGWVQTPGAFKITPKMTLLGAVAAAGGELFSSNARILRTDDDGQPITAWANLSKIRNREEPDIPVQAGDVVIVDKSLLGSAPYLLYTIFNKFNTGMYLPPP
ncbi:MAG: polysaccharide biosynthesis/export family protein [Deltaproteobacteria bacterium]|nr:polysaccharide biosynthesis/export family protein [Deltaproteobacteria bacterium]